MTYNQIMYQNYVESKRSNLAKEAETNRSNLSQESLKRQELAESGRHNLVTEEETKRSNLTEEQETNRANLAKESENHRHNMAAESNQLAVGKLQAETSANNAKLAAAVSLGNAQLASQTSRDNAQLNAAIQQKLTEYKEDQANARHEVDSSINSGKLNLEEKKYYSNLASSPVKAIGGLVTEWITAPQKGKTNESTKVYKMQPPKKIEIPKGKFKVTPAGQIPIR